MKHFNIFISQWFVYFLSFSRIWGLYIYIYIYIYIYFSSPLSSVAFVWIQWTVLCLRSLICWIKNKMGFQTLIACVVFQRPCIVRRMTGLLVHRWEGEVVSSELYLQYHYLVLRFGAYEIEVKYFRKHCYFFVFISYLDLVKTIVPATLC